MGLSLAFRISGLSCEHSGNHAARRSENTGLEEAKPTGKHKKGWQFFESRRTTTVVRRFAKEMGILERPTGRRSDSGICIVSY